MGGGGGGEDSPRESLVKQLVREVIELFGASRCMFCSNLHQSAAMADSDGLLQDGPTMQELYRYYHKWTADLGPQERTRLFSGTAAEFYRIEGCNLT